MATVSSGKALPHSRYVETWRDKFACAVIDSYQIPQQSIKTLYGMMGISALGPVGSILQGMKVFISKECPKDRLKKAEIPYMRIDLETVLISRMCLGMKSSGYTTYDFVSYNNNGINTYLFNLCFLCSVCLITGGTKVRLIYSLEMLIYLC